MKTLPSGLAAHYAGTVLTLATCVRVQRRDGQVFRFTSHTRPLTVDGEVYAADGLSITASSLQQAIDGRTGDTELTGLLSGLGIKDVDVQAGRWDFASVRFFEVNFLDVAAGINPILEGNFGEVSTQRGQFRVEIQTKAARMQQPVGRVYSERCDADLGDARCKVNLAPLTVAGTVTTATSPRVFVASALTQAANYFTGGKLTMAGGLNVGLAREVKLHSTGGAFELYEAFPFTLAVGDTFTVYPGCNKVHYVNPDTLAVTGDCKNKFANVVNFRGFPFKPGRDKLIADA